MTAQGTLTLQEADDHTSPFAVDETSDETDETDAKPTRESQTLADFGADGQATLGGFEE